MFQVYEAVGIGTRMAVVATLPTFEEAKAKVEAMGVVFMEDDADYPGCADAFLKDGRIIAIQPEGFKL